MLDNAIIKRAVNKFIYRAGRYGDNDCPFCGSRLPHCSPGDTIDYLSDEKLQELSDLIEKELS